MSDNINPGDEILIEMNEWWKDVTENKAFGDIPVVSDILYAIGGLFTGLFGLLISGLTKLTAFILEALYKAISSIILAPINTVLEKAVEFFVNEGFIDGRVKGILDTIIKSTGDYNELVGLIFYFFSLTNVLGAIMEVSNVKTQQNILEKITPMLPNPEQLTRLLFINPDVESITRSLLRKYGFNNEMIDLMKNSNQSVMDESQIQLCFWRGLIGITDVIDELRKHGYTDTDIVRMYQSWEIIPSIRDILYMVGKEAFEPDQINRYGLNEEFPYEVSEWLNKQGYSEFWQQKEWIAHWSYPSPQQVLEMLHRGFITENDVSEYYRVVEIPRYWRENLIKVNYRPYSRVDVRRMHLIGVLDDNDLLRAYMDIGYDREKAEKMREFTILYNKKGNDELTRAQILSFYKTGIIKKNDAFNMLDELGYPEYIINYFIKDIDLKIQKEYIKEVINTTEYLYVNNKLSYSRARDRLITVNVSSDKVDVYLAKWEVVKEKTRKLPSKEDLQKFYIENIITTNEFKEYMGLLGYDDKNIEWYIKLLDKSKK